MVQGMSKVGAKYIDDKDDKTITPNLVRDLYLSVRIAYNRLTTYIVV